MHIIAIYKPHKMQISYFTSILETTLNNIPINCPTIIAGNFNIDMLTKPSQSIILQKFMNNISLLDILKDVKFTFKLPNYVAKFNIPNNII